MLAFLANPSCVWPRYSRVERIALPSVWFAGDFLAGITLSNQAVADVVDVDDPAVAIVGELAAEAAGVGLERAGRAGR